MGTVTSAGVAFIRWIWGHLAIELQTVCVGAAVALAGDGRLKAPSLSCGTHVCPSRLALVWLPSSGGNWRTRGASLAFRSAGCGEFDENVTLKMHVPHTVAGLCLYPRETALAYDK